MSVEIRMSRMAGTRTLPPWMHGLLGGVGALAILLFLVMVWRHHWEKYSDFDVVYVAGLLWRRGIPPYNAISPLFRIPDGPDNSAMFQYYYLPMGSMLASLLSFFSFPMACLVWRMGSFVLLLYAVWRFSKNVLPDWPDSVRLFALGVTALAGSLRWALSNLQATALIVALLILFASMVIEKKWLWATILGVLISVKITYMLPVVLLLLFRRQYKPLAVMVSVIVVLNLVALIRTGPQVTLAAYRETTSHFEDPGSKNRPDALDFLMPYLLGRPDSPLYPELPKGRKAGEWAGEQIHLAFTLSAWRLSLPQAKIVSLLFSLAMFGMLAALWKRTARTQLTEDPLYLALFFSLVMALSLLVVYHQRYDAIALLPLTFVSIAILRRQPHNRAAWTGFALTFVFAYLLSGKMLDHWQGRVVVPHGLLILAPLCGYFALAAFAASAVLTWRYAREVVGEGQGAAPGFGKRKIAIDL